MNTDIANKVENIIKQRHFNAEMDYKYNTSLLYKNYPALQALDIELRSIVCDMSMDKDSRNALIIKKQAEIDTFLKENSLKMPTLDFTCKCCNDTGYVNGKRCNCFTKLMIAETMKEDEALIDNNFDNFDLDVFAEKYKHDMESINRHLYEYSQKFPNVKKPNIALYGNTGTGKTYLLSCVYNELKKRGSSVIFVTAGRLFDILKKYAFDIETNIDMLYDAEMLIIDDLGTEPIFNNITIEYMFMLINERSRNKKPICFSSNLTPDQLKKRYTERIFSRLFDRTSTTILQLPGDDLHMR